MYRLDRTRKIQEKLFFHLFVVFFLIVCWPWMGAGGFLSAVRETQPGFLPTCPDQLSLQSTPLKNNPPLKPGHPAGRRKGRQCPGALLSVHQLRVFLSLGKTSIWY